VPRWRQLIHILLRTAGLLVMGVSVLNNEEDKSAHAQTWGLLAFSCLLFAWCSIPRERGPRRNFWIAVKALGVIGLVEALATCRGYRGPAEVPSVGRVENWAWLRAGWWRILGLTGWGSLTAALITLALGNRREWLMGAMALFMALHLAFN